MQPASCPVHRAVVPRAPWRLARTMIGTPEGECANPRQPGACPVEPGPCPVPRAPCGAWQQAWGPLPRASSAA